MYGARLLGVDGCFRVRLLDRKPFTWPLPNSLDVFEQGHEAEIHVQLLMTVKQREAGIIRNKIDLHLLVAANHDDILDDTGRRLPCQTRQFETVAVKVDRMNVVARVAHAQPIPLALLHAKHRLYMISANATPLIVHRLKPPSAAFCLAKVISKT